MNNVPESTVEFTSQPGGLHCPLQQTKQVSQSYWKFTVTDCQPSIPMDFQKIRKKNKQLTPSPRSSSHDQPGGRSNRTPPRAQVSSFQPIVNRFLGNMFINSMSTRPLALPNHHLYNLLPLDTSPRNGAPAHPPGETRSDEVKKCQEQLNLQKINPENP